MPPGIASNLTGALGRVLAGSLIAVVFVFRCGDTLASTTTPVRAETSEVGRTETPTVQPTLEPTIAPPPAVVASSSAPSPIVAPSPIPTATPTQQPTATPTQQPTATPTQRATPSPTPKPNSPPQIERIGDQSGKVGQRFVIRISASDPDGDKITLSCGGADKFTDNGDGTGTLEWTGTKPGKYAFICSASDGKASSSTAFAITVD
jgi:hypothetical protein